MPRLLNGQTIGGRGAGGVWHNGVQILPNSASPGWGLTNDDIVFSDGENKWRPSTYLFSTKEVIPTPVLDEVNIVKSGAGVYAAGSAGPNPFTWVSNDKGLNLHKGLVPLDVDRETGTVVLKDYATGANLFLVDRDSDRVNVTLNVGVVLNARSLNGNLVYEDGASQIYGPTGKIKTVSPRGREPILINTPNGLWVIYYDDKLYAHPVNDNKYGYAIPGLSFYPDAEWLNGELLVASSNDQGDRSARFKSLDINNLQPINPTPVPVEGNRIILWEIKKMGKVPQLVNGKMLNSTGDGSFTLTLANPLDGDYVGIGKAGDFLPGNGDQPTNDSVFSVQPDGSLGVRPKGTVGAWEKCKKQNGLLVWNPDKNKTYAIPFVE